MKETARFFKVLADEARLKMLWLLFNRRELCVCDIMEALGITQSKASRHLAALRNAGLATDRREGLWSYYSLRPAKDEVAAAYMKLLQTSLAKCTDSKQLSAKLNAWLKTKKRGDVCQKINPAARSAKNAKSGIPPSCFSGGVR